MDLYAVETYDGEHRKPYRHSTHNSLQAPHMRVVGQVDSEMEHSQQT